jgi:hypothetical protein
VLQSGRAVLLGHVAAAHAAVQGFLDRGLRFLDPALVDLDHRDVHARAGAHLGDPRTHQAATDHSDTHGRARYLTTRSGLSPPAFADGLTRTGA